MGNHFEQFFKTMYLIDTDYRSMLLAKKYVSQPLNFIEHPVPKVLARWYETQEAKLLHMPASADSRVLPQEHHWVMAHVDVFGGEGFEQKLTPLAFCCEKEMIDVVHMKGVAGGKNSDSFGEQNFRRAINPQLSEYFGNFSIVAKDKLMLEDKEHNMCWGATDVEYAVAASERGREVVYAEVE